MASDEKRIEHGQPEAVDHAHAGKPITTPEDNARHGRQQKLDSARSFRLTTDKNNSFTLEMGDGKHVKDSRALLGQDNGSMPGKGAVRPENAVSAELLVGPNVFPQGLQPGGEQSFRAPGNSIRPAEFSIGPGGIDPGLRPEHQPGSLGSSNQSDLLYQPAQLLSAEKVRDLLEQVQHPNEASSASEAVARMHDAASDGKMTKDHDNQSDAVVDSTQEKMIGGKVTYEMQNGMQVVIQGDSSGIGVRPQIPENIGAMFASLHGADKLPDKRDSNDASNSAVTNTERTWYGRPEQQGRQLAGEILRGDFLAFNQDRNVEKFHFTPEQLKVLQETFQQVIAEQQFYAVHVLICTPEEATQRLHNIDTDVKDGLINAEQAKGIKEKYDQLESNWSHITNDR